jgi:phosphate butyryltransferase
LVFKSFDHLFQTLKKNSSLKTVVAVCPDDAATLEALIHAAEHKICRSILIGDQEQIIPLLKQMNYTNQSMLIIHAKEPADAATRAVSLVREGRADFLMKGNLDTSVLLKAVLHPDSGLRDQLLMSHLAFLEIPGYHKLMVLTDSGMVLEPTLDQKKQIVTNVVSTLKGMGYTQIKIGALAAVEKVNSKMKETVEAQALADLNQHGEWPDVILEGPISYDLLMSHEIALKKNYTSKVSGDADVMLVDRMTTGNILGKALIISAGALMAGLVVGAKVPIALNSRGSSMDEKLHALMLAALCLKENL